MRQILHQGILHPMPGERTFHSPVDYLELARSPDATPAQLQELAGSDYDFVQLAVSEHPRTPPETLMSLVPTRLRTWNDAQRLINLIRNPATPVEAFQTVPKLVLPAIAAGAHKEFEAGVALAEREDTPEDLLAVLVNDIRATTQFRKVVARQTTHPALRDLLRSDRSERVRRAASRFDDQAS